VERAQDRRETPPAAGRFGLRFWAAFIFYNVAVHFLFALFWLPALAWREFRGRFAKRLGFGLPRLERCIWLHAPSVGEALAVRAFVAEIKRAYPAFEIVLTTFTSGGRQVARNVAADHHFALPYDLYASVAATIAAYKPALVVLVEGDYWPNLMFALRRRRVPIVLVNGRFPRRSLAWYRRGSWLFKPLFGFLRLVCAAEPEYVASYEAAGVPRENVVVTGNLKYDNYEASAREDAVELIATSLGRPARDDVLVAASVHAGEEEMFVETYLEIRRRRPALKLFLAPRYPERAERIRALLERRGIAAARRSRLPAPAAVDAVVLDTLGELAGLYPLGAVALMGGSFVPHVENFPVETARLAGRGGIAVRDGDDLVEVLTELYEHDETRALLGQEAARTSRAMMGASRRTVAALRKHVPELTA
jgi:3-deoxy-D-manno-octulosonic-acid transferase